MEMTGDPLSDDQKQTPIPSLAAKKLETFKMKLQSLPERIPAFGLISALFGVTMFSFTSLIVKTLTELHAIEVLVFRCLVQLIPYFIITIYKKYPFFGQSGSRLDLGFRCITGTLSLMTLYMAYRMMPLSDSSSIYQSSPVFVTVFAFILLKERITVLHVITGAITIVGVFIISKPEFLFGAAPQSNQHYENRTIGIILSLVAAITSALSLINLRKLKTTPVAVIVMWYSLTVVVIGSAVLPFLDRWVLPKGVYTWLMLLAIGCAGILNQFFQTLALKYESPGPISVIRCFNIVLSFIWEVLIFVEPVEWTSILGALLISVCVVIISINKCYSENPQKFKLFLRNCCCFGVNQNKNPDHLQVPDIIIEANNGLINN